MSLPLFLYFKRSLDQKNKSFQVKLFPSKREWLRITAVSESTVFGIRVVKTTAQTRVWTTPSYRKPRDCIFQCLRMNYASQNEAKWVVFDSPSIQTNQPLSLKHILLSEKVSMTERRKNVYVRFQSLSHDQGENFFLFSFIQSQKFFSEHNSNYSRKKVWL